LEKILLITSRVLVVGVRRCRPDPQRQPARQPDPVDRRRPEILSVAVPSYEPRGPYGAKEEGEGSMVPVLGSIANAIYDAVGVRITELPITPERVLKALAEKHGGG
jgi:hypothetical protein